MNKKKMLFCVLAVVVLSLGFFSFIKANQKKVVEIPTVEKKMDVVVSILSEKENVENYLKKNITILSPIPAVLGGTWQVLSFTINVENKTGTVLYEDGHLSENKKFTYSINENAEVLSLTIFN